jgi:PAS domain S-box-containing protein
MTRQEDAKALRRAAERHLDGEKTSAAVGGDVVLQRLIHELQVHQIELEMQNNELRSTRSELEALLTRYTELYDFAPIGYFTLDRRGNILQANLAGARLLESDRSSLIGRRFADFIVGNWRTELADLLDRAFLSHDKQTGEFERISGNLLAVRPFVQLEVVCDGGDMVRVVAIDISDRRRAEVDLRESEERFRSMADAAPVLILVSGKDGLCNWLNQRWMHFTGRSMAQELGHGWLERVHADDQSLCRELFAKNLERYSEFEFRLRNAAGDYVWMIVRAVPRFTPDGDFIGHIACCFDIHLRKLAEQWLADAKIATDRAIRTKSAFLANMSHEMRTPLHVIIGLGHLLRRDLVDPLEQDRLEQLCATSDHLLAIVNDVLDLSKLEAERFTLDNSDFRLDTVIRKVVRLSEAPAQAKGLRLIKDVAPAMRDLALNGDALRLARVLINLCSNAVKFTDQGSVCLAVACLAETAENVTLRFTVTDSGIGIEAADQLRLFGAFEQADSSTTRERGGTGLGLTISQQLVTLMGGKIEVDSLPGSGCSFHFELTLLRAKKRVVEPTSTTAVTNFQGSRILLAEDHQLSQEILFEMLEGLGCTVDLASDGTEAVELAQAKHFDLILMDVQMPRMDGLTATRVIRTLPANRATPVLALTANAFAEDRQRCLEAGMSGHVGKPVTPAGLAHALGKWLGGVSVTDEIACVTVDNALSRALETIPGLDIGLSWRGSPEQLSDYCLQLNRFLLLHDQDMALLRRHLGAGEVEAAGVLLHKLLGIAGLVGVERIASTVTKMQEMLRSGSEQTGIERLASSCEAQMTALKVAVARLPIQSAAETAKWHLENPGGGGTKP